MFNAFTSIINASWASHSLDVLPEVKNGCSLTFESQFLRCCGLFFVLSYMHLKNNNQRNQVSKTLLPWTCWVTSARYFSSLSLNFPIIEMGILAGMQ